MEFAILWSTDDEEWMRAHALASDRLAADEGILLLDDFLVYGTIHFMVDGRPPVPVPLTDPQREARPRWTMRRGLGAAVPSKTCLSIGYDLPLFEFAWQLAHVLDVDQFEAAPDGARGSYHMFDEAFELTFVKSGETIWIASYDTRDHGWALPIPSVAFFDGLRQFLREFAGACAARLPHVLQSSVGEPLRPYLAHLESNDSSPRRSN